MSRAFVREDSDAPLPPPLERAVSVAPNLVTPRGARLIDAEVARVEAALAAGPPESEAPLLQRDLRYWAARRASAQIVSPDPAPTMAGFATRVTICRRGRPASLEIVGEDEADPAAGRVAWTSPLARALDGAVAGDSVELVAGGVVEEIAVEAVQPLNH